MGRRYDAVGIGAGHNGLVCAAYLARAGLRVVVLERRDRPGGLADTEEIAPGFRTPAAAHTVGRLRRSVLRDLGLARRGLRLIRPPARAFAADPDGRPIPLWEDPTTTAEELRGLSPADAEAYPRFDRKLRALASFLAHLHAQTPPDTAEPSLSDTLGGDSGLAGQSTVAVGGPGALAAALTVAARSLGAEVRYDSEVARVTTV